MEHKKLVESWLHEIGVVVMQKLYYLQEHGQSPRKRGGSEMDGGWMELDSGSFQIHVQIWQGADHYRASVRITVPDHEAALP